MNQTKRLLCSIKLANSLYRTQFPRTYRLNNQVPPHFYSPDYVSPFFNLYGVIFFSSKPEQALNRILSENWSDSLELELSHSKSDFTHENVMYVIKKLSKDPKKASSFFNWVVGKLGFQPSSAIYSLMLRIYGNKEMIKQFWSTAQKMKQEGLFIDDQEYMLILRSFKNSNMVNEAAILTKFHTVMLIEDEINDVVKEVVRVVMESDWANGVEKRLGEMKSKFKVSDNFVLRVLKELRTYPMKAMNFFQWVSLNLDYEHTTVTYNGILRILGQEESIEVFWSVFKEMKSVGHEMDLDTYLKIARLFQKRKMLNEAVELYEHMMDSPYKPSVQDSGVLLRAIAGTRSPDLDLVFRVVNKFEATGNSLSKSIYDAIHRSLTSLGQFDEAEKMMKSMKDAGYEPDNITYSQLIFGLCKARRLEDASNVIDVMESNGCVPDIKTWTILIQGYCSANEVDKAVIFLANMVEKGCNPDADLLDVLINGFLSRNRTIEAHESLLAMVKTGGVRPWQETYKNLIRRLLGEKKFDEALELLRLMKKHTYPPFSEPFHGYLSKFGTVDEALEFLKALNINERVSVSSYQNMFQSFFDEGREFEAKDMLFKCPPHIRKHKAISSLFGSVQSSVI